MGCAIHKEFFIELKIQQWSLIVVIIIDIHSINNSTTRNTKMIQFRAFHLISISRFLMENFCFVVVVVALGPRCCIECFICFDAIDFFCRFLKVKVVDRAATAAIFFCLSQLPLIHRRDNADYLFIFSFRHSRKLSLVF